MIRTRTGVFFVLVAAAALALAGCGGNAGSGYTSSGTSTSTSATTTTATTGGAQSAAALKTASAMVSGKSVTILTNDKGLTLYYLKSDSATHITCTGGCAQTWPPLLTSGMPTTTATLPGTLSVLNGGNGVQATYNGHPLYTYSGDSAPGDTKGEGIGGVWFVATPALAAQSGSGSSSGY